MSEEWLLWKKGGKINEAEGDCAHLKEAATI